MILNVDVALVADAEGRVGAMELSVCPLTTWPHPTWPRRLAPEDRRGASALLSATDSDGRRLDVGPDGVRTLGISGCARLVIDVGALAERARDKDVALRVGDDLIATPDVWLWRPDPFPPDAELRLRVLPSEFQVVLPWHEQRDGRFIVDARTFALKGQAAFGRFTSQTLDVAGATLEVTALGPDRPPVQVSAWLIESAQAVAALSGRFPVPRMAILLCAQPAPRPVLVGYFSRGGGPVALFFVSSQPVDLELDDHETTGRWVLTHELAHAWLPPVVRRDAWFNEGLATWQQDLLARRAGIIKSDEAYWLHLLRGLDTGAMRAASDQMSVAETSVNMHARQSYQHTYWAGVALILLAEVEARQAGASIDDVVLALRRRFPDDDRPRSALELLAAVESEGGPVAAAAAAWRKVWERERDQPFPDTRAALQALGVARDAEGRLLLDDDAPLAHVRHALTAPSGANS
jgi:hypothetical protein